MLLSSHISAYARFVAEKVCGLVRSTLGTSQGEDKLGARDMILNTKVVRRANIPPKPVSCRSQSFNRPFLRSLTFPTPSPTPLLTSLLQPQRRVFEHEGIQPLTIHVVCGPTPITPHGSKSMGMLTLELNFVHLQTKGTRCSSIGLVMCSSGDLAVFSYFRPIGTRTRL